MMNKLLITKSKESDAVQLIDLSVIVNGEKHSLFVGEVDVNEFIEWFFEHEKEIREHEIPINKLSGQSLAENIYLSYNILDVEDDEIVDKMYEYRSGHCLRFAARGNDFPEIYIGKLGGVYEISKYSPTESWRYPIDIDGFFNSIK